LNVLSASLDSLGNLALAEFATTVRNNGLEVSF
jgi:hypothetical protein